MRRIIALTAITMLIVSTVSVFAAGRGEAARDDAVSVMVFERGQVPSHRGTLQENQWVDWMREQSGVNLSFVPVPRWEVLQTLNPMFAAGTAPDVISDFSRDNIASFHAQGVLAPLDDWIEQYSTSLRQYLADNPTLDPFLRFGEDGQKFAVATMRPLDTLANHLLWVRQDWLDELGLDVPRTEEEFFAVADAFVTQDPNRTGTNDTFAFVDGHPLEGMIHAMYMAGSNSIWFVDDREIYHSRTSERLVDYFRFYQLANERGWIDPELITDRQFDRQNQLWVTGRAGMYFGQWGPPRFSELRANDPNARLTPIGAISTRHGTNGWFQEPPPERFVAFRHDTPNPQAAIQYLDWLVDEGWFNLVYGFEGEQHGIDEATGIPVWRISSDERRDLMFTGDYVILRPARFHPEQFILGAPDDPFEQELAQLRTDALVEQISFRFRRDTPMNPTMPELLTFYDEFNPVFDDIQFEVSMGRLTPEAAYRQVQSEWNRLGGPRVQAMVQDWFDQNQSVWASVDWQIDLLSLLEQ